MNQSHFENVVKDLLKVLEMLQSTTCLREVLERSTANEQVFIHHLPQVCKEIVDYYEYSQKYEIYEYFRNQRKVHEK